MRLRHMGQACGTYAPAGHVNQMPHEHPNRSLGRQCLSTPASLLPHKRQGPTSAAAAGPASAAAAGPCFGGSHCGRGGARGRADAAIHRAFAENRCPALGEATAGERVLVGVLTQPPTVPLLLASHQDQDAVGVCALASKEKNEMLRSPGPSVLRETPGSAALREISQTSKGLAACF
eukprot:1162127-Pelagomonas_calceolata.AAC.8